MYSSKITFKNGYYLWSVNNLLSNSKKKLDMSQIIICSLKNYVIQNCKSFFFGDISVIPSGMTVVDVQCLPQLTLPIFTNGRILGQVLFNILLLFSKTLQNPACEVKWCDTKNNIKSKPISKSNQPLLDNH